MSQDVDNNDQVRVKDQVLDWLGVASTEPRDFHCRDLDFKFLWLSILVTPGD